MTDIVANIDGPQFRRQRELLLRLAAHARSGEAYMATAAEHELLEGLINLTDKIADEAYDRHGIKCLLTPRSRR
jgi:hypothetical protein